MDHRNIKLNLDPQFGGDGHRDPFLQDEKSLTIEQIIPRIIAERGSFLNVTEESLLEEIEHFNSNVFTPSAASATPELHDEKIKKSHEDFLKQRAEIIQLIKTAYNETALSLDFISLLVSSIRPANGSLTMSPHLKQFVPSGSLNSSKLNIPHITYDTKSGQGWRQESLSRVSETLRNASLRLSEGVLKERVYWNRINEVLSNNEVLFKMRDQNSRAIGIKYGFGDAGSNYHDKGIAILKKMSDGDVIFTPTSPDRNEKIFKSVRVRILEKIDNDFVLCCQSSSKPFDRNLSINDSISRARYFLFEEELFYQLIREASTLLSFGVQITSNKIIIEFKDELIEIESIVPDSEEEISYLQIDKNNKRAEYIITYLRLLLCAYHKSQLDYKQRAPTFSNKIKQESSRPILLRSLLGHIRHEANLSQIGKSIKNVFSKYSTNFSSTLQRFIHESNHTSENTFDRAIVPPSSKFIVSLTNEKGQILHINLRVLSTSSFCSLVISLLVIKYEDEAARKENRNGVNVLSVDFTDMRETEDCLTWVSEVFMDGESDSDI